MNTKLLSQNSLDSPIVYIVVAGYLIFMVIIGAVFSKLNRNTSDYFRGGSKGSWWLCGSSAYVSAISAYTFTAAAGVAYYAGLSVLIIYLTNPISQILVYFFYAARIRQKRLTTPGEVYRERFNPVTQQIYSIIGLLTGFVGSGMGLYTLAIFVSVVFGFNMQFIIIILGIVVLFYSITGGRWAVMATDFLQCLIMFTMSILITVLCLRELGGVSAIFDYINNLGLTSDYCIFKPERSSAAISGYNGFFTWKWCVALMLVNIINNFSVGVVNYSVKDGKEAKKAVLLFIVLSLIGVIFFFIPPFTARFLYASDVEALSQLSKPGDAAYAIICLKLLPPSMIGLMVVAMFASAMSSMDTSLNGGAANFILNVYPPLAHIFKWRERTPEKMLFISRFYCLLAGVLAVGLALLYSYHKASPLKAILTIGSLLYLPMAIPMFWGLFLKRIPQWTPVIAMTVGFITSLLIFIQMKIGTSHYYYHHQVFTIFIISSATVILSLLFSKRNAQEYNRRVDGFYTRMNTPVIFKDEVGGSNDKIQLKVLGNSAFAGGIFVMLLAGIADNLLGVICPLAVGGTIVIIGGTMVMISRKGTLDR